MRLKILALVSIAFLISGCIRPNAPMSKKVQEKIKVADASLIIKQSNLDITVQSSDTGQLGLIGSLVLAGIDAVRRSSVKKESAPIIAKLEKYNFRNVMLTNLNSSFGKLNKFKINRPITLDKVGSKTIMRTMLDRSKANAVLFCDAYYKLESGNLIATLDVTMYPKTKTLRALIKKADDSDRLATDNQIYKNRFSFIKQGISPDNITEGLNEAAESLSTQLVKDLNYGLE